MKNKKVLLEQRPERWRRHPILTFSIIGLIFWPIWYIQSKAEKLTITKTHIIYRRGILRKDQVEVPKKEIRKIKTNQSLLQRMLGMGELSLTTSGDTTEIVISGFAYPERIKEIARK